MAETRRYLLTQSLDLEQILSEAQNRWLRPPEICEILRNHQRFHLTSDPPIRPPAGSLFLFNRKTLRYFRKDGHRWRKKKDGKTVKEAHEKLKTGSVDVLHCYYAHGEDNENFQRRCYWMLDQPLEHIVLVHYREIKEGYKVGASRLHNADPVPQLPSPQTSSLPYLDQPPSPSTTVQMSYASSPTTVDWNEQAFSSEFEAGCSGEDQAASSIAHSMHTSLHGSPSHAGEAAGLSGACLNPSGGSSLWPDVRGSNGNLTAIHDPKLFFEQPSAADFLSHKLVDAKLGATSSARDFLSRRDGLIPDDQRVVQEHDFYSTEHQFQNCSGFQPTIGSTANVENGILVDGMNNDASGELKKLDSFGRWMDREIGRDCDDSFMASDSTSYWNTLDTGNDVKEVSSLSHHIQLDTDSLSPSLSQEQLFSICDFAPDWAYSGVETKVLITGTFLRDVKQSFDSKWSCMFGEIEVCAEVLTGHVIRCQVPSHAPGRVPFYVTCSNRLACSEVREFEYREQPSGVPNYSAVTQDEVNCQIRLARMLYLSQEIKYKKCSLPECDKCKVKNEICSLKSENVWQRFEELVALIQGNQVNLKDALIRNLLKEMLFEWLVHKTHEGGKGPNILDDKGQGVIHLAAALGYDWAMAPIAAAGVSPNFRDARGRTALHWAAYCGREETVIALVRLGAAPGAVNDPTPAFPGGQTAADLASGKGHKGIAGYLAEADLTSHLSSLTVNENLMDTPATVAAERAFETAAQNVVSSDRTTTGELRLKGSLAAIRKSAHAAALIQAALRSLSFRVREPSMGGSDVSEVPVDLVALGSLKKVQKKSHFEDYLHSAAIKIQQKYRGWKGRKEFLRIRNRIVKIQAHVRGHQVRKQYKKVVWSVSIVEKAILRWRRKKPGLRGFRRDETNENTISETDKNDEYEYLRAGRKQKFVAVEKALARVKSMVRHPEAQDQYMRLVMKFENSKLNNEES